MTFSLVKTGEKICLLAKNGKKDFFHVAGRDENGSLLLFQRNVEREVIRQEVMSLAKLMALLS
jgi:hypothetical protein